MLPRFLKQFREKLPIFFVVLIFVGIIYIYMIYLQEYYRNVQSTENRCVSELSSVKYQLNVITEYKKRIDKLLTESQKAHEADKAKFKDMVESCVAMKQQSTLCQSQFEDLQTECHRAKESLIKATEELTKLRDHRL